MYKRQLVNSSITSTMSRTVYTSITTLIMLIVLFIMGVTSVKEFTLPLIVGIVVGAYSSVSVSYTHLDVYKRQVYIC